MLLDQKTFDTSTSAPLSPEAPHSPLPPQNATAEAKDRRDQDKALALMICHVLALVLAVTFFGGPGLMAWALTSVVLAGLWVFYTTLTVPGSSDH
jgi:hypothetical protein